MRTKPDKCLPNPTDQSARAGPNPTPVASKTSPNVEIKRGDIEQTTIDLLKDQVRIKDALIADFSAQNRALTALSEKLGDILARQAEQIASLLPLAGGTTQSSEIAKTKNTSLVAADIHSTPIALAASADSSPAVWSANGGRGQTQHRTIERRLREAAELLGFRSAIGHAILDSKASVDLVLTRHDIIFACEIAGNAMVHHEVRNVADCVKAGYANIAVLSFSAEQLARIKSAIADALAPEAIARVKYFLLDQFIDYLNSLPPVLLPSRPTAEVTISHGYKIKRSYPNLTRDEAKARENVTLGAIADLMFAKNGKAPRTS